MWDEVSRSCLSCLPKTVAFVAAHFQVVLLVGITGDPVFLVDIKTLMGCVESLR